MIRGPVFYAWELSLNKLVKSGFKSFSLCINRYWFATSQSIACVIDRSIVNREFMCLRAYIEVMSHLCSNPHVTYNIPLFHKNTAIRIWSSLFMYLIYDRLLDCEVLNLIYRSVNRCDNIKGDSFQLLRAYTKNSRIVWLREKTIMNVVWLIGYWEYCIR